MRHGLPWEPSRISGTISCFLAQLISQTLWPIDYEDLEPKKHVISVKRKRHGHLAFCSQVFHPIWGKGAMGGREVQLQPTPRSGGTGQVPDHQLPAWGATCLQERINWLKGFFTCNWIPCYYCDYSTNDSCRICYPQASQGCGKRSWLAARHRAAVPQPKPHGEPERFCNVPWPCLAAARVCCHLLCFWIGIISDWSRS